MFAHNTIIVCLIYFLAGSGVSFANDARKLSFDEAMEAEREARSEPTMSYEHIWIQPENHSAPCKLPTSEDQIARPNFKAYWHGKCLNGFAFGLGRDIATSDTHHTEEIAIYKERGELELGILYDMINGKTTYRVLHPNSSNEVNVDEAFLTEHFELKASGLNAVYDIALKDNDGKTVRRAFSPFVKSEFAYFIEDNIVRKISMFGEGPMYEAGWRGVYDQKIASDGKYLLAGPQILFYLVDEKIDKDSYVADYLSVQDAKEGLTTKRETVRLPKRYREHISSKILSLLSLPIYKQTYTTEVFRDAYQLERTYLFKNCSPTVDRMGIPESIFFLACDWKDKYREPYNEAVEALQERLEHEQRLQQNEAESSALIAAITAERTDPQIYAPKSAPQSGSAISQAPTYQPMQPLIFSPPQVQPIPQPGQNRTTCITVGRVTNCQ